jgi:AraC-like DNA-binding protein
MMDLLQTITAGAAFFLAFLVVTVRTHDNVVANRWLALFLFLVGIFILDGSLLVFGSYQKHPQWIGYLNLPLFALAPSLYMAVSQFVAVERRLRKRDFWHFLPFFLFFLLSIPFLLSSDEIKLHEIEQLNQPLSPVDKVLMALVVIQMIAYLVVSYFKLKKHQKNVENITASPTEVNLNWLLYFLYGIVVMVLIWFYELFFLPFQENAGWYTPFYFAAIYSVGYFALRQKELFPFSKKDAVEISEIMAETEHSSQTSRRTLFSPERLSALKDQLLETMSTQKPFLDSELSLPVLARQLGLSVHELSELVNEGFGENFAQFINRYRIEESKRLLRSEKHGHLNMVGIAYEAGFNSKTVFNTAFKRITGMSPSEFQQLEKIQGRGD